MAQRDHRREPTAHGLAYRRRRREPAVVGGREPAVVGVNTNHRIRVVTDGCRFLPSGGVPGVPARVRVPRSRGGSRARAAVSSTGGALVVSWYAVITKAHDCVGARRRGRGVQVSGRGLSAPESGVNALAVSARGVWCMDRRRGRWREFDRRQEIPANYWCRGPRCVVHGQPAMSSLRRRGRPRSDSAAGRQAFHISSKTATPRRYLRPPAPRGDSGRPSRSSRSALNRSRTCLPCRQVSACRA